MSGHANAATHRGAELGARRSGLMFLLFALAAALATSAAPTFADAPAKHGAAARELEGRLIAPCCWTQTLDIHDSPIADQLRAEIAQRLHAGESAQAIEDDLAARYGDKIRAVPRGEDPRVALPVIVGAAMSLAALWLAWLGVVWLRRTRHRPDSPSEPSADAQQYDTQLDQALNRLSDDR